MYRQDYFIFVKYKNKKQKTRYYDFYSKEEAEIMLEAVMKSYMLSILLDEDVEEITIRKTLTVS